MDGGCLCSSGPLPTSHYSPLETVSTISCRPMLEKSKEMKNKQTTTTPHHEFVVARDAETRLDDARSVLALHNTATLFSARMRALPPLFCQCAAAPGTPPPKGCCAAGQWQCSLWVRRTRLLTLVLRPNFVRRPSRLASWPPTRATSTPIMWSCRRAGRGCPRA
jgi:hypothetical protein